MFPLYIVCLFCILEKHTGIQICLCVSSNSSSGTWRLLGLTQVIMPNVPGSFTIKQTITSARSCHYHCPMPYRFSDNLGDFQLH